MAIFYIPVAVKLAAILSMMSLGKPLGTGDDFKLSKINQYFLYNGTSSKGSKSRKYFFLSNKLLLYNMTASSGLRENVYPCKLFFSNVHIYNIIND